MCNLLFFLFLFFSTRITGQVRDNLLLSVQLHPQLAFHKNDYAYRSRPKSNVCSFGYGISANLHYNLTNKLFASAGLGYNVQPIHAIVFLDQGQLPPPYGSPTQELVGPKRVSFRTVYFPLDINYRFISKTDYSFFVQGGLSLNYLLNTYYTAGPRYEGGYKKNYWQGYSLLAGFGGDYMMVRGFQLTYSVVYSFINTVRRDPWLFSQDEDGIAMKNTFIKFAMGIKAPLHTWF